MIAAPAVHILGRADTLADIGRLTSAAAAGRGGVLVISAGPGEGRTALLHAVAAAADDWTVLTATGFDDERDLPYASLQTLLTPLRDRIAGPTPATRDALSNVDGGNPGDPLAVGLAALSLLRTATRTRPVLCLIDDAHLLDPHSWRAVLFAARRIGTERIAIVASVPTGTEPPGLPVHRLAPLGPVDARRLLAGHAPDLAEDVAGTIAEIAAGHPGALIDLVRALTPEQRRGYAPPPETLPLDSPLRRRLAAELDSLPPRTRDLLLLAAAA
ncbi:AAA family ATPase, partial [Actinoplanes sichuanensis]